MFSKFSCAKCVMFVAVSALIVSSSAQADVVYATNFNAPTYSDNPLIGQDGWLITGTSVVNPIAVANTATNGNVLLTTTGQDVNRPFTPAATSTGYTNVYLTADITVTAAQSAGDYFLHLGDGGTNNFNARIYAKAGSIAGTYQLAMGTSSGTPVNYGVDRTLGETITLLARYDFVDGAANDTGALFINPTNPFGIGNTAYIAATTIGTDALTISSVNLRQGTAASAPTVTIDNISVNTTAIPEPSSIALLGLMSCVGLTVRRRMK